MEEERLLVLLTRGEMNRMWMLTVQERRRKFRRTGNQEALGRVGVLLREEKCDEIVEIKIINDTVMSPDTVF